MLGKRNRSSIGNEDRVLASKRKSLRLQHSISLHIPMSEISGATYPVNCFIDIENQKFDLTYLGDNETHNPNSLKCLEMLKKKKWEAFLVGNLCNFNHKPEQMKSLKKVIETAVARELQDMNRIDSYNVDVSIAGLNPTENDKEALDISVVGLSGEKDRLLYKGYLLSWCSPTALDGVTLPIMLCTGSKKLKALVHSCLKEKLDVSINSLQITPEEFVRLFTYCLIMLDKNDNFTAKLTYAAGTGSISVDIPVESLLNLWQNIHKEDRIEVELDEVTIFNKAFEILIGSTVGINLGRCLLQSACVPNCFSLQRNGQVKISATKIIHVVLKYLNTLALQRLRVKATNSTLSSSNTF